MRKAVLSLATLAISSFVLVSTASAQSGIIRQDLNQCRNEIVQFQNAASQYFRNSGQRNCSRDAGPKCDGGWYELANEVAAQDPISFFWKGSSHCEGGSYTCFGEGSLQLLSENPEYVEGLMTRTPSPPLADEGDGYYSVSSDMADICIVRAWQKRTAKASTPVATPPVASAPVNSSPTVSTTQPATKRRHVPDAVAAHCLTPKTDSSGVTNECGFAVEYIYCVVNPKEGSWSTSFDCGQNKTGSWQVEPNSVSIMHTEGDEVQYFACKYGPALAKPDGISPTDFHFNGYKKPPTGRCAQWGSK